MENPVQNWRELTKSERDPHAQGLLQNLFVAEALDPSGEVFLISPWTRNIGLIDNHSGQFDWVDPDWPRGRIRLLDWVRTLCRRECRVNILQGDDQKGRAFNAAVHRLQLEVPPDSLHLRMTGPLSEPGGNHAKAILTPQFVITGSMNISDPGLEMHIEHLSVSLRTNERYAAIHHQFSELWRQSDEGR